MGIILLIALWLLGLWAIVMLMRNIRMEMIKQQRKPSSKPDIAKQCCASDDSDNCGC